MYEEQNKMPLTDSEKLTRMLCETLSLVDKKGLLPQLNQEIRNWWTEYKHTTFAETEYARRSKILQDRMADWEARKPRLEDVP